MVRLLLRLSLAALVVTAAWRVGTEYLTHYRFREAVRSATMVHRTEEALQAAVLEEAGYYAVPLVPENLTVSFNDRHVVVRGAYVKVIEILPGVRRPWTFRWAVETFNAPPIDAPRPGG